MSWIVDAACNRPDNALVIQPALTRPEKQVQAVGVKSVRQAVLLLSVHTETRIVHDQQ